MSYKNDDYADEGWDQSNSEKSYEEDEKELSDYEDLDSQEDRKFNSKINDSDDEKAKGNEKDEDELESGDEGSEESLMLIDTIPQKRLEEIELYDSFGGDDQQPSQLRITSPFISKYEKSIIIGKRASQISKNSPIYVELSETELKKYTALDIAELEFELDRIPLIIRRFLPDKTFEDWKISELKKLPF